MSRRRRNRTPMAAIDQINVTPLLDLTFLLLIVFMISMPLMEYGNLCETYSMPFLMIPLYLQLKFLYSGSKNRATSTIQYEPAILHFYYRVTTSCKTSILQNHTTNYLLITSLN